MSAKKIVLNPAQMRQIARYEITFKDLVPGGDVEGVEFVCPERYDMTLDDLYETLKKLKELVPTEREFRQNWYSPLMNLSDEFGLSRRFDGDEYDDALKEKWRFPGTIFTEDGLFCTTLRYLDALSNWEKEDEFEEPEEDARDEEKTDEEDAAPIFTEEEDFDETIDDLERFLSNRGKPFEEWTFSLWEKKCYIWRLENDQFVKEASDAALALGRKFVDELCEQDDEDALYVKGYSCYGGNRLYPTDWRTSRDCIARLYEKTDDPSYANTLGYIAYYGRCNDGVPDYDAAFRYFVVSCANGVPEGVYKLGDMFRHGYGCRQSEKTALALYERAYRENRNDFLLGGKHSSFADAALRMGLVYSEGIGAEIDVVDAFYYLLEAEYAARLRVKDSTFFGDGVVLANVEKKLEETRGKLPEDYFGDYFDFSDPRLFQELAVRRNCCELSQYQDAEGRVALVGKRIPTPDVLNPDSILITVPKASFCERSRMATLTLSENAEVWFKDDANVVRFDYVAWRAPDERWDFYCHDELVAWTKSERYRFYGAKTEAFGPERRIAVVCFSPGGRGYDYFCDDAAVQKGDRVIVEGYDGEKEVEVVEITTRRESELALPLERYKTVLRKA